MTLPPDLIEAIVDDLALQKDTPALKACALTSKFMNFCSRKHLFSAIHMGAIPSQDRRLGDTPRIEQLVSLLTHSPEIADCIKELSWKLWRQDYRDQTAPIVLKRLTNIRSLTLVGLAQFRPWKDVPIQFQEAMAHLIQLPSVTKLVLQSCHNIPMALFMSCPNLTHLKLEDVELQDKDDLINLCPNQVPNNPPRVKKFSFINGSPASLEKLLQVRRPDTLPFFDFSDLLHLSLISYGEIGNLAEMVLKETKKLTSYTCQVKGPATGTSQIIHPQHLSTTLRCLKIKLRGTVVLPGLFQEMKSLVGMNVLEELKLIFEIKPDNCTVGEEWRGLDEILTPSNFPHLRRVKISIKGLRISKALKGELLGIPEIYLLRLNANPSVTLFFSFSDIIER